MCICIYLLKNYFIIFLSWSLFRKKNCTVDSSAAFRRATQGHCCAFKFNLFNTYLLLKIYSFSFYFYSSKPAVHLPFIHVQNSELSFNSSPSALQAIRCQVLQTIMGTSELLIFFSELSQPFVAGGRGSSLTRAAGLISLHIVFSYSTQSSYLHQISGGGDNQDTNYAILFLKIYQIPPISYCSTSSFYHLKSSSLQTYPVFLILYLIPLLLLSHISENWIAHSSCAFQIGGFTNTIPFGQNILPIDSLPILQSLSLGFHLQQNLS